jgi:hypothetical protein
MIEFKYSIVEQKKFCFISIEGELKRKFLVPECDNFFSSGTNLMVELEDLRDYFLEDEMVSVKTKNLSISYSFLSVSKEKFSISLEYKGDTFTLKSYIPFWGKTLSNTCWVGIVARQN